jgi:hypothetical protein
VPGERRVGKNAFVMNKYIKMLGFGLLGVILVRTDTAALARVFARADVGLWGLAFGMSMVSLLFKAVRWNRMLATQGIAYPYRKAVTVYFAGIYLGFATPGRLGELSRVLYLKRDFKTPVGLGLSTVVLDRLVDLCALIGVGLIACYHFNVAGTLSIVFLFGAAAMAVFPFLLLSRDAAKWFTRKLFATTVRRRVGRLLSDGTEDFYLGMERMISPKFISWFFLTLAAYTLFFLSAYVLSKSLQIPIGFIDVTLVFGLANLLSLIPVTVAGVGTRDAIFVYAFAMLSLMEAEALAYSAFILVTFYLGAGAVGFFCFLGDRPVVTESDRVELP